MSTVSAEAVNAREMRWIDKFMVRSGKAKAQNRSLRWMRQFVDVHTYRPCVP